MLRIRITKRLKKTKKRKINIHLKGSQSMIVNRSNCLTQKSRVLLSNSKCLERNSKNRSTSRTTSQTPKTQKLLRSLKSRKMKILFKMRHISRNRFAYKKMV